ncbi:MAG TPA: riboflavin synthase [Dehalococcoidales bacterium]|nr:riboflavin synthase [Dehalococcoidales bacterium]
MFTGIVEEIGKVSSASTTKLVISARQVVNGINPGDSIAINGACLTVTDFDRASFSVDVMPETLQRTNLGQLKAGDGINLERPTTLGGRLGGHLVQGHIDDTGRIIAMEWEGEALLFRLETPPEVLRYTAPKGFIAVDGISLTITEKDNSSFQVSVVEYTRRNTTLGSRKVGDVVNLEVDIIAKYVAQFTQPQAGGLTAEFLIEHGFTIG